MTPSKSHWLVSMGLALFIHGIVVVALTWVTPQKGNSALAGTSGIEISLGPAGSTASAATSDSEPQPETVQPKKPTKPQPPMEKIEPVQQEERLITSEPVIQPVVKVQDKQPEEPEIVNSSTPEALTDIRSKVESNIASSQPAANVAEVSNASQAISSNGVDGDNSAGGGLQGDSHDYIAALQAWLERHKRYPTKSRRMRQEGTAMLYFHIDRQGRVLKFHIHQSSGHRMLDREVLAMIKRAQPLPAFPDHLEKDSLELVVPIEFILRRWN